MLPYIRLGPYLLQTPGLAVIIGMWVMLSLIEKEAIRLKLKPEFVSNLVFFGLIAGILGARLTYAARYLDAYIDDPISFLALNPSTLSPNDGILIGLLVAVVYGSRKKLLLRPTLDALAPGLAFILVSLGVAHFLNGDAFGAPSEIPWAVYLWDEFRHPSQVYETLAALGVFALVMKRPLGKPGKGINFLLLLAISALTRIFLEAFRGDSLVWTGGFRAAQIVGLIILTLSLLMVRAWSREVAN